MIEFPCNCGYRFTVTDDLAGGLIQCPQCKRLNDIPTLNDLNDLDNEGIYKIEDGPDIRNDPKRVEEMTYVFTRDHYDEAGEPIDIRGAITDGSGDGPIPVESLGPLDKAAPKYDPITGELVRALDIKPDPTPPPAAIPMARAAKLPPPSVIYGMDVPRPLEVFSIPFRLLKPANVLVMCFILLAHGLGTVMAVVAASPLGLLVIPIWLFWHGLILAHYGNVVDELGPTSHDELPTPLRHLGWHEDLWGPFSNTAYAVIVSLAPAFLILLYHGSLPNQVVYGLAGTLVLLGIIAFPAVLITTLTSGAIQNLRPDRLLGVIARCGAEYVLCVILCIVACGLWAAGVLGTAASAVASTRPPDPNAPLLQRWYVAWSVLVAGTYFMHLFCWHLGTVYRKHCLSFPWILQRHEPSARAKAKGFPVQRPSPARGAQSGAGAKRAQPVNTPRPRRS